MRFLILLVCCSIGFVSRAEADPQPGAAMPAPVDEVRLISSDFPVGGAIVGYVECFNCPLGEEPFFMDANGQTLVGTFQSVPAELGANAFVWLADSPLAPGIYVASLPSGFLSTSFSVREANSTPAALVSRLTVSEFGAGTSVSCTEYESAAAYKEYFRDTMKQGNLGLQVDGEWTQFTYSVTFDQGAPILFHQNQFFRNFAEPTSTCFQVVATPILGGDEMVVGEDCIAATDSADWGLQGRPHGTLQEVLAECTEPPAEYFDTWCAQFANESGSAACGEACEAAQTRCAEGPLPPDDDLAESEDDAGSTSTGSTSNSARKSDDVSGCALGGASGSSGARWAWAGLFFLALGYRRRSLKA